MRLNRLVSALSLALSVTLLAGPVSAATKTMTGPTTRTPEVRDGMKGAVHEYVEYTYTYVELAEQFQNLYKDLFGGMPGDFSAIIDKLNKGELTIAQVKADLEKMKDLLDDNNWYQSPGYTSRPKYIDSKMIDKYLGPVWNDDGGNDKRKWLADRLDKAIYSPPDSVMFPGNPLPNTTSSFIEVSRLANLYDLASKGYPFPVATITGNHLALGTSHAYTIPATKDAIWAQLKKVYALGVDTSSPIVLDLNHDGRIGVTGKSSAVVRNAKNTFVEAGSVLFDLRAVGTRERFEWLNGDGDGFLVYDRNGEVTKAAQASGAIDGRKLFGDAIGYEHGYEKLVRHTVGIQSASAGLGGIPAEAFERETAKGDELKDLKVWIDGNRDALVQPQELRTLASLGITEIGLKPKAVQNQDGETLIVSHFIQNGERRYAEDVWFAIEPARKASPKQR
ncbi:MAG TPA: hypothetical protein V6D00_09950 [Pantanalinema sp.]